MMEQLEEVEPGRMFYYINLFNVSHDARLDDIYECFKDFEGIKVLANQTIPGLYDIKLISKDHFCEIIKRKGYSVCGRPFYLRFS